MRGKAKNEFGGKSRVKFKGIYKASTVFDIMNCRVPGNSFACPVIHSLDLVLLSFNAAKP